MEINDSLKEVLEKDTWRKIVHVKSSLEPKQNQYAMFWLGLVMLMSVAAWMQSVNMQNEEAMNGKSE